VDSVPDPLLLRKSVAPGIEPGTSWLAAVLSGLESSIEQAFKTKFCLAGGKIVNVI
jgi:hypothetical protein